MTDIVGHQIADKSGGHALDGGVELAGGDVAFGNLKQDSPGV